MKVKIICNDEYWCYTLSSWVYEVKDLIESEFDEDVEVIKELCSDCVDTQLYINEDLVLVGIPGEEGYLLEIIKKYLRSRKTSN
jgi:hypothetical protein